MSEVGRYVERGGGRGLGGRGSGWLVVGGSEGSEVRVGWGEVARP